jgi:predicted PurR-regulated permease PerM
MMALIPLIIQSLPTLISIINNLTGKNVPPHLVEDGQKLYKFVTDTIDNLKQNAPLTPEQDAELDRMIEELPKRDYWQSKG